MYNLEIKTKKSRMLTIENIKDHLILTLLIFNIAF
jgi:hypothetical protein